MPSVTLQCFLSVVAMVVCAAALGATGAQWRGTGPSSPSFMLGARGGLLGGVCLVFVTQGSTRLLGACFCAAFAVLVCALVAAVSRLLPRYRPVFTPLHPLALFSVGLAFWNTLWKGTQGVAEASSVSAATAHMLAERLPRSANLLSSLSWITGLSLPESLYLGSLAIASLVCRNRGAACVVIGGFLAATMVSCGLDFSLAAFVLPSLICQEKGAAALASLAVLSSGFVALLFPVVSGTPAGVAAMLALVGLSLGGGFVVRILTCKAKRPC